MFLSRPDYGTTLITGASRGIGKATALRLARRKRSFCLVARGEDQLRQVCGEMSNLGSEATPIPADLSTVEGVAATLKALEPRAPLRTLILNAGISNNSDFLRSSAEDFEREYALNYLAPVRILKNVLPDMIAAGRGRVIVVGSLTALVPFPGNATYAASKAALLMFLRSLRVELAGTGVSLTCVLPGLTRTDLSDPMRSAPLSAMVPALEPEDVARSIDRHLDCGPGVVIPGIADQFTAAVFQLAPELGDGALALLGNLLIPRNDGVVRGAAV